ncbi:MAG: chemotaxis protein CheW [Nitrospirae bacterium]|nr:chemotaxis protein CheW [Nitrospirota bacterium]
MTGKNPPGAGSSVDWEKIHGRLRKVRSEIEKGWVSGSEEEKRILRARAQALAIEPERENAGEETEVVEFLLANETYGVDTSYVREVYPLRDVTPVPCTPRFVTGIISVRGQILSIVDLKKFFDLPEKGLGDLNKVIILRSGAMEFGILADSVLGVSRVPLNELQPPLPTLAGAREDYLRGVTAKGLIVIDAGKILSDRGIIVDEQV